MLPKEYTTLFNAMTDALDILVAAQVKAEEIFISREQILKFPNESEEETYE